MKTLALYDRNCSLCKKTKGLLEQFDFFHKVEWVSLQEYEEANHIISFTPEDIRAELHIILPNGNVVKGYYAVRKLLISIPAFFLLGILMYIPLVPVFGNPIYRLIAKNRYKWRKNKCNDGSCSIK